MAKRSALDLPDDLWLWLTEQAEDHDRSVTQEIRMILRAHMRRNRSDNRD